MTELKQINYCPSVISHHPKSIIYWITEGIIINDKKYSIKEFILKDDKLSIIVSSDDLNYFEVELTKDNKELLDRVNKINNIEYKQGDGIIISDNTISVDNSIVPKYVVTTGINTITSSSYTDGVMDSLEKLTLSTDLSWDIIKLTVISDTSVPREIIIASHDMILSEGNYNFEVMNNEITITNNMEAYEVTIISTIYHKNPVSSPTHNLYITSSK